MHKRSTYLLATRHPWSCFLFLLPLLAAYEGGILLLGGGHPHTFRNGADTWLRWALEYFGLSQLYWAPLLIAGIFIIWSVLRRKDRPADLIGVETGMVIESIAFAVGLWGISQGLDPLLKRFGLLLYSALLIVLRWLHISMLFAVALAALASSALFSAAHHVGPYGESFDNYVFVFRMLAGLYFALLYQLRGFGIAVGAHACYDVVVGVVVVT